jgi:membrane fusion protein, macrolide-specific efflux system
MKKLFANLKTVVIKHKKISILFVALLTILLIVGKNLTNTKAQTPQYQTSQVVSGSIISTLTESGNISTLGQINVNSPTDGFIEETYVKNGDEVIAGQALFKVKSTATPSEKASAYASYLNSLSSYKTSQSNQISSQSTLEKDRKAVIDAATAVTKMENNRNVSANNPDTKQPYTQNEIESIYSTLTSARETFSADEKKYLDSKTSVSASQASLNSSWLSYQATLDSVVTAPVSGTVANFSSNVGNSVTGSSNNSTTTTSGTSTSTSNTSSSGTTVLILGNFSKLMVKASISEVDIPNIHTGQKATITLDAFPGKTYVGTVTSIDTIGTSSSNVVTYNAYIELVSVPLEVHPGMTASVVIQTAYKDSVLKVPISAIQTTNGQSTVRVLKNGKISEAEGETGITSDSETEIVSGVSEGDVIITGTTTASRSTTTTQGTSPFSAIGGRGFGGAGGAGAVRIGR